MMIKYYIEGREIGESVTIGQQQYKVGDTGWVAFSEESVRKIKVTKIYDKTCVVTIIIDNLNSVAQSIVNKWQIQPTAYLAASVWWNDQIERRYRDLEAIKQAYYDWDRENS